MSKATQRRADRLADLEPGQKVTFKPLKDQSDEQLAQWTRNFLRPFKAQGLRYRTAQTDKGFQVERV